MKAVLISIRPKWCSKIVNGEKTIEVRKTKPKLEPPFKCYIYMTKGFASYAVYNNMWCHNNGGMCVIGEFVCDRISKFDYNGGGFLVQGSIATTIDELALSCLTDKEFRDYAKENTVFGWHISDLRVYDKPLELRQFVTVGDCDCMNCHKCFWSEPGNGYNVEADCGLVYEYLGSGKTLKPLFRPPQSWCYVEDMAND